MKKEKTSKKRLKEIKKKYLKSILLLVYGKRCVAILFYFLSKNY